MDNALTKLEETTGYGLDELAINTIVTRWRFQPGTMYGTPVDVQILVEVSFRLYSKPPVSQPIPVR